MVKYKCFQCNKQVELSGRRVRCPYCGSKILFKQRASVTKVKAI